MDHSSYLVLWLLGVPIVLAIVDRMMIGGGKTSGAGAADDYIARHDGRPHVSMAAQAARPL